MHDSRLVAALYNATFSVVSWGGAGEVLGRFWQPGTAACALCAGSGHSGSKHGTPRFTLGQPPCVGGTTQLLLQVVSGDESGTLVMWNVQSGRREGGFSLHSHPATATATSAATSPSASTSLGASASSAAAGVAPAQKLTAMAFDANQRRLLTATDGGAVAMWNFNSGAVLRRFKHREGSAEITAVACVQRQQQQQQGDDAEGEHAAGRTGEADGGQQGAAKQQAEGAAIDGNMRCSEHALLLSMQQHAQRRASQQPQPQQAAAAEQEEDSGSADDDEDGPTNLVLATGWSRNLCIWEEGEAPSISQYRRLAGHAADVLCMAPLGADVAATGELGGGGLGSCTCSCLDRRRFPMHACWWGGCS